MFRIVKSPRAWWPVTWTGVAEDGTIVTNRVEMRFRLLKLDQFVDLMREAAAIGGSEGPEEAKQHAFDAIAALVTEAAPELGAAALLDRVRALVAAGAGGNAGDEDGDADGVVAASDRPSQAFAKVVLKIADDWRGVASENGEPLVWNVENVAQLMNEARVFDRTMEAFREVTQGAPAIRAGN